MIYGFWLGMLVNWLLYFLTGSGGGTGSKRGDVETVERRSDGHSSTRLTLNVGSIMNELRIGLSISQFDPIDPESKGI